SRRVKAGNHVLHLRTLVHMLHHGLAAGLDTKQHVTTAGLPHRRQLIGGCPVCPPGGGPCDSQRPECVANLENTSPVRDELLVGEVKIGDAVRVAQVRDLFDQTSRTAKSLCCLASLAEHISVELALKSSIIQDRIDAE